MRRAVRLAVNHSSICPSIDTFTIAAAVTSKPSRPALAIRSGPGRRVNIPKGPGRGDRTIVFQNLMDRVVQRAAMLILGPVFEPGFDDRSFGFRPGRGVLNALATAERLTASEGRTVWVADDIRDAFGRVPVSRLLQIVRKALPDEELLSFLKLTLTAPGEKGLRQGGSLSSLMLNVLLDHMLDRPWRRLQPDLPLIRYADDLLVLARTTAEGEAAHEWLSARLVAAGMPLKSVLGTTVNDLVEGASVPWLGFEVTISRTQLDYAIPETSWEKLTDALDFAHTVDDAPLRAVAIIEGWLTQKGPCYRGADRRSVLKRVASAAAERAFDEIPAGPQLLRVWKTADRRWQPLRTAEPYAAASGP